MDKCCENLLSRVADMLDITPEELKEKLEYPKCSWIYKTTTSKYSKNDRCRRIVLTKDHVFCEKHHRAAGNGTNCTMIGNGGVTKNKYVYTIGVVETIKEKNKNTLKLIQGDLDKFTDYLKLSESQKGFDLRVRSR
jgi:hypothetical protein